jgi:hypothetical protein
MFDKTGTQAAAARDPILALYLLATPNNFRSGPRATGEEYPPTIQRGDTMTIGGWCSNTPGSSEGGRL